MHPRVKRIVWWLLALLLATGFASLGVWQFRRAVEKQGMLDEAAAVLAQRTPRPLAAAADPARSRDIEWTAGEGRFDARGPLWLDNQRRGPRVGLKMYCAFAPADGAPLRKIVIAACIHNPYAGRYEQGLRALPELPPEKQ